MIEATVVLCAVLLFVLFCMYLELKVDTIGEKVEDHERITQNRITGLEVKDYSQDNRLDEHRGAISRLNRDVKKHDVAIEELGKDVGWSDDNRKTQVLVLKDPNDDSDS